MNKYSRAPFKKVNLDIPLKFLQEEYLSLRNISCDKHDLFQGRGCSILDLTYVDPHKIKVTRKIQFAGTSTQRAVSHFLPQLRKKEDIRRLQVSRQRDPLADDCNHNSIKEAYRHSHLFEWIASIGPYAKVTFSTLHAHSWWPSHYDFSADHALKLNIPIFTNDEAVSVSWNQREKKLHKVYMKEGECWWLQSAFKHTAFNWGKSERTFLLITFHVSEKIKDLINADL